MREAPNASYAMAIEAWHKETERSAKVGRIRLRYEA
jgi:hypothetical protein